MSDRYQFTAEPAMVQERRLPGLIEIQPGVPLSKLVIMMTWQCQVFKKKPLLFPVLCYSPYVAELGYAEKENYQKTSFSKNYKWGFSKKHEPLGKGQLWDGAPQIKPGSNKARSCGQPRSLTRIHPGPVPFTPATKSQMPKCSLTQAKAVQTRSDILRTELNYRSVVAEHKDICRPESLQEITHVIPLNKIFSKHQTQQGDWGYVPGMESICAAPSDVMHTDAFLPHNGTF